jgi:hypothetical protein
LAVIADHETMNPMICQLNLHGLELQQKPPSAYTLKNHMELVKIGFGR